MSDVDVRPLRIDDVVAAQAAAYNALRDAGKNYGWEMPELDDDARLSVRPGGSRCVRSHPGMGPMSPYLPSGVWG